MASLNAQNADTTEYFIAGTVKNTQSKEVLVGAEVFIGGSNRGAVTDHLGNFSLCLEAGEYVLFCSYMGFQEKRIPVSLDHDFFFDIFLEIKKHEIGEVDVIASLRKEDPIVIGRPIENIGSRIVNTLNTNDVNDALHGRIPGVWTTKISGAPGDHNRVRIRGLNSIFGSPDPLYVVDGMVIPIVNSMTIGISDLNTHDVENISVLKDASSTALYGYLGGNGVILVDTKKGGGETRFEFGYKKGIQSLSKRYNLMNSEDFLATIDSSDHLLGTRFLFYSPTIPIYPKYPSYLDSEGNAIGSDNHQDRLFRIGDLSEYHLSGQGSIKNLDYYISGNYYDHKGVVSNTRYKKYSLTANLSRNIGEKILVRFLYKGSVQDHENTLDNYLGNKVIFKGINYDPAYSYTPDSTLHQFDRLYYNFMGEVSRSGEVLHNTHLTPDELINQQSKTKDENAHSGTFMGEYRISSDFKFDATISLSKRNYIYSANPSNQDQYLNSDEGVSVMDQQYNLKYKKQMGKHRIDAMFRYRYHRDNTYWEIDSISNPYYLGEPSNSDIYLRGSQAIYGEIGSVNRRINSSIFNLNYNYARKYFISIIANYDRLREGYYVDQRNLFPSITLNWDLAQENIFKLPEWIDAFNVYANWGQVGNYPLNSLSNDLYTNRLLYTSNQKIVQGVGITNLANHYLVHEEVTETNFGARLSFLQERINLAGDYYIKNYQDLLLYRPIPYYYGGGLFFDNIGEMKNSGIEVSLELIPVRRNNTFWSTKASFSSNNQYISKLHDGLPIELTNTDPLYPDFIIKENIPLGEITGYKYIGKWKDLSEAEQARNDYENHKDLAYQKNDTTSFRMYEDDKMVIGNSLPDFTFNWINYFEYKNFSCEMLWYGVIGVDKYNATKAATYITGNHTGLRAMVFDSIHGVTDRIFYESSYFIEDASFVRLKSLRFTYRPTKKMAKRVGMEFSFSFENLITLTRYTGYDPEATIYTYNTFTDNAMDWGAYPSPRGYYISINLDF